MLSLATPNMPSVAVGEIKKKRRQILYSVERAAYSQLYVSTYMFELKS